MRRILVDGCSLELHEPEGFTPMASGEPDSWVFARGQVLAEVRLSRGGRPALEFTLRNSGDDEQAVTGFRLTVQREALAWLAGAVGRIILGDDRGAWIQVSGWCSDGGGGQGTRTVLVFGAGVRLAPGQQVWSRWRLVQAEEIPSLPDWVPTQRHLTTGRALMVPDLDVALSGEGLGFETVPEGTLVQGPVGLHQLRVQGPTGISFLEVGWHHPLPQLIQLALEQVGERADLEAWLIAWLLTHSDSLAAVGQREQLLDRLDVALGHCFEKPGMWGALAGLYAFRGTELPVRNDAISAARELMRGNSGSGETAFLAVEAMIAGEPELATDLLPSSGAARDTPWELLGLDEVTALRLLSTRLEHGLPVSGPVGYAAEDVALAQLWLAAHPDSAAHMELSRVVRTAQRRLMCGLSAQPEPASLAWLLLGQSLMPVSA